MKVLVVSDSKFGNTGRIAQVVAERTWLGGLAPGGGVRAAAFDTRFARPRWLASAGAPRSISGR